MSNCANRECAICHVKIYGSTGFSRAKYHMIFQEGKIKFVKTLCGICAEKVLRRWQKIPKGVLF